MPEYQRVGRLKRMMRGVEPLPAQLREPLMQSREQVPATYPSSERETIRGSAAQAAG